jgi:hypothetical protein
VVELNQFVCECSPHSLMVVHVYLSPMAQVGPETFSLTSCHSSEGPQLVESMPFLEDSTIIMS